MNNKIIIFQVLIEKFSSHSNEVGVQIIYMICNEKFSFYQQNFSVGQLKNECVPSWNNIVAQQVFTTIFVFYQTAQKCVAIQRCYSSAHLPVA
jgi:hypothetical protein